MIKIEKDRLLLWVVIMLISVLSSVFTTYIYDRYFAQKIVAFDLRGFIAEQRDLYLEGKINDEQFRTNVSRIESIITGIPKRKVVLMGDAVIRHAEIIDSNTNNFKK